MISMTILVILLIRGRSAFEAFYLLSSDEQATCGGISKFSGVMVFLLQSSYLFDLHLSHMRLAWNRYFASAFTVLVDYRSLFYVFV